ncbi:MAG: sulfotransferase domain-containing protein [Lentisphaeria bacterium]|nr:sulfotransferase domain-containing protein [Lentisphaeria bacterium]
MPERNISNALQQARKKNIHTMGWLRIMLTPFTFVLQNTIKLSRMLGLENTLFEVFFRNVRIRNESAFADYTPTKNDIFICSYIKSGTNWAMQIAHQIANRGQGEYENIHDVVSWPEVPIKNFAIPLLDTSQSKKSVTGLRVIKTHLEGNLVPHNEHAKYICVVRDPKDVVVSSYFFMRTALFGKLMPSVSAWLNNFLSDVAIHGPWANFLHTYWLWQDRDNVLFLTYEDMIEDLPGVIRKIASFVTVDLTDEEFERICYLSSYSHMKAIDHKFYPGRITPFSLPVGCMMRNGKSKNASELFNAEQQAQIDEHSRRALEKLGCDFPYDEHFKIN